MLKQGLLIGLMLISGFAVAEPSESSAPASAQDAPSAPETKDASKSSKADRSTCMQAWRSAMYGDISAGEASANVLVGFTGALASHSVYRASGTVGELATWVAMGGVILGVALTENQEFGKIDQIFKQALVGTGDLLSELGTAAKRENIDSKAVIENIKQFDPRAQVFAKLMCTSSNQPVILGRYLEKIFTVK